SIIMLLFIISLIKALSIDQSYYERDFSATTVPWSGDSWKERLERIVSVNTKKSVNEFINSTVKQAFHELQDEFAKNGIQSKINTGENPHRIELEIGYDEINNFIYGIRNESNTITEYLVNEDNLTELQDNKDIYPKSYFGDDREGYDVPLFTKNELIYDVLKHYERFIESVYEEKNEMFISSNTNQRLR